MATTKKKPTKKCVACGAQKAKGKETSRGFWCQACVAERKLGR